MRRVILAGVMLAMLSDRPLQAKPIGGLERVGLCAISRIKWVGGRLEGPLAPGGASSGSAFALDNGVYGVDYGRVPAVDRSKAGDRVRVCLIALPRHCPPGDDRGREYRVLNLRTRQSWTLPDAQHMCGGA